MGNPHVGFDEAGAGNGLLGTAPVLDPTGGGKGAATPLTYPVPKKKEKMKWNKYLKT